ncbi:SDR family NAD(P)-dependent oxidoreductase [Lentzea sp.]|uniref:SDR family NAD(P)-dependent oxidoreductase n=1 Tax=Lentzea sp. TaxID=56099 RepID=UPI002ED133DB
MSGVLADKVAVVTGGSSGIGLAIARKFVAEGARVFVTSRKQAQLDAVVADLGPSVVAVRSDVGDLADLDALFAAVREQAGRIDVLALNAGGGVVAPLEEITEEQFDTTFASNVKGVLFGLQKALPLLSRGASVIVTGSTTSVKPDPGLEVYGATKAAVRNLVRSWTLASKARGFRVNVLSPGPTETPGLVGLVEDDQRSAFLDQLATGVPLGRVGAPDEIAAAALFLASDASSFVNGAELFVDGGYAQV